MDGWMLCLFKCVTMFYLYIYEFDWLMATISFRTFYQAHCYCFKIIMIIIMKYFFKKVKLFRAADPKPLDV